MRSTADGVPRIEPGAMDLRPWSPAFVANVTANLKTRWSEVENLIDFNLISHMADTYSIINILEKYQHNICNSDLKFPLQIKSLKSVALHSPCGHFGNSHFHRRE